MLEVAKGSTALVTGASSGIGREIAKKLAGWKIPVLLVARSGDALRSLAAEWRDSFGGDVDVLALDLTLDGAARQLEASTEEAGRPVDLLVNAAGFGYNGPFVEQPVEKTLEMLRLNILATTELTHRFLSRMRERRRGRILNVASTAGFLPMPYFAAYAATKAYVLSLTHALHEEAKSDGVTVSCLCPGYTKTAFHGVAGMRGAEATPFPEMRADDVAEIGLRALEDGKAVVVTHLFDRLWIASGRLVPRGVPPKIAAAIFKRTRLK